VIPLWVRNRTTKTQEITLSAVLPAVARRKAHREVYGGGEASRATRTKSLCPRLLKMAQEAGAQEISVHAEWNGQSIERSSSR